MVAITGGRKNKLQSAFRVPIFNNKSPLGQGFQGQMLEKIRGYYKYWETRKYKRSIFYS